MIIAVYEDKFKRTKKVEQAINKKIDEINPESEEAKMLRDYMDR